MKLLACYTLCISRLPRSEESRKNVLNVEKVVIYNGTLDLESSLQWVMLINYTHNPGKMLAFIHLFSINGVCLSWFWESGGVHSGQSPVNCRSDPTIHSDLFIHYLDGGLKLECCGRD